MSPKKCDFSQQIVYFAVNTKFYIIFASHTLIIPRVIFTNDHSYSISLSDFMVCILYLCLFELNVE